MARRSIVLNPTGDVQVVDAAARPRLEHLQGRRLGFLDNSKLNGQVLLRALEGWFQRERSVKTAAWATKTTAAGPMSDSVFERLRAECEAVVTAVGD